MTGKIPFPKDDERREDEETDFPELTAEEASTEEPTTRVIHEDEDNIVTEDDEGNTIVKDKKLAAKEEEEGEDDFYANLVSRLSPQERDDLALELGDFIEKDLESRKKRDEQYAEGIRRTGLGDDAPGGANFNGASDVVHPALAEACVDFSAAAIKELFPSAGPVRTKIIGQSTPEKVAKARRKADYMNYQFTQEIREYRSELEQLLTQLPLGGSQYMLIYWDSDMGRAVADFVPIDDIILPFSASNFYAAHRKTHQQNLTELEYQLRVDSGLYEDEDDSGPPSTRPQETKSAEATDKVEGKEQDFYNEDGLRKVYHSYVTWSMPESLGDKEKLRPYLVILDDATYDIKGIYRNWDPEARKPVELTWIVEWTFIPWRGAYGIGLPHLIGTMSGAATGALRALLDTAHINNSATLIKLKGRANAQSTNIDITGVTEIEGNTNIDDIRKIAMPLPFNPPSPVLYQLLDWLTVQMKGVVSTAEEKISETSNQMPVGTALALIEQGSKVFSAIHARLHASQHEVFKIVHRLNRIHLDDEVTVEEMGELTVRREDFEGPIDVIPVSDPNIFSEAQRFAQIQAVEQRATAMPQLYKAYEVEKRLLETLKFPDPDSILVKQYQAENINAVAENVAMGLNRPVEAYEEQDHLAHLRIHLAFLADPNLGSSPLVAPGILQAAVQHLKEHALYWYQETMEDFVSQGAGMDFDELCKDKTDEARAQLDRVLAVAAAIFHNPQSNPTPRVIQVIPQQLLQLGQVAQQALQAIAPLMQAGAPPDPAIEVAKAEIQRKASKDAADAKAKQTDQQLAAQKLAQESQATQAEIVSGAQETQQAQQLELFKEQKEDERLAADAKVRLAVGQGRDQTSRENMGVRERMNEKDNETALTITAAELASGQKTNLRTGTGINP